MNNSKPMVFSEDLLSRLTKGEIVGDFPPFNGKKTNHVKAYNNELMKELKRIDGLLIEPDFTSYGSGFASYGEVKISKRDRSDTVFVKTGRWGEGVREDQTNGLVLYISTLAPYWFYGGSNWLAVWHKDAWRSGASAFMRPESMAVLEPKMWHADIAKITAVMHSFGYGLLLPESLAQPAPAGLHIPTILSDAPFHQVFDCFFYWED